MKCMDQEKLFGYVHGMLEAREEAEVRAHLERCATCQAAGEEFRRLDAVLDEWKPREPSPWFDARVRAAVAQEEQAQASRSFLGLEWRRWLVPALLMVLAVAATLAVIRLRSSHRVPEAVARKQVPTTERPKPLVAESRPAAVAQPEPSAPPGEDELTLYENLPVLENYDLLANFDVLSELPKRDKQVAN